MPFSPAQYNICSDIKSIAHVWNYVILDEIKHLLHGSYSDYI